MRYIRSVQSAVAVLLLLAISSCADPVLLRREVQEGPTWLVRLDAFQTSQPSAGGYDHPVSWKPEDISAILARCFLEERLGLMDQAKPAQPLFSPNEIDLLYPAIRKAFEQATRAEWVVFVLLQPHGVETGVTSGALFVESHRLHVVVANHRRLVAGNSTELARVRENPFYSIKGSGGTVAFESARFTIATRANWTGGHRASASELVLDHTAFLSYLRQRAAMETPPRAVSAPEARVQTNREAVFGGNSHQGLLDDRATMDRLRAEVEHLKQQLAEKDLEIERLRGKMFHPKTVP